MNSPTEAPVATSVDPNQGVTPRERSELRTAAALFVGLVALIGLLYYGADFLTPIAIAVVLSLLLRPVVAWLKRRCRIPVTVGALCVTLAVLCVLVGLVWGLSVPVRTAIDRGPELFSQAHDKLARLRQPIQKATQTIEQVTKVATGAGDTAGATPPQPGPASSPADRTGGGAETGPKQSATPADRQASEQPPNNARNATSGDDVATSFNAPQKQEGALPPAGGKPPNSAASQSFFSTAISFFGGVTHVAGTTAEVLILTLLLLAGDRMFEQKFAGMLADPRHRRAAHEVVEESQSVVSRYVYVTALINVGQAIVIGLLMWWIGMPAPLLWAGLTLVLEFVPFLGAATMLVLLSVVSLASFDIGLRVLAAPGLYLVVTNLQNNLISPWAYGRRLALNPVAVLVGVLFWWYVWGVPGAFIAVPLLAMIRLACERIDPLKPVATLLDDRRSAAINLQTA